MKKIMFEKLTVKETAHIRGALLNIRSSTMLNAQECSDDPDSGCSILPDPENSSECEPGLPHVQCTSEPSVECSPTA